jgi:hypothetical protein
MKLTLSAFVGNKESSSLYVDLILPGYKCSLLCTLTDVFKYYYCTSESVEAGFSMIKLEYYGYVLNMQGNIKIVTNGKK